MALVDTSSVQNSFALPLPSDVAAAHRGAAEAYALMMGDHDDDARGGGDGGGNGEGVGRGREDGGDGGEGRRLLEELVEGLMRGARDPPREVRGVGQGFLDGEGFFLVLFCFSLFWWAVAEAIEFGVFCGGGRRWGDWGDMC